MTDKTLILVDTSGYVFRSHYALINQGLTAPDGQATHVIMGVLNMLERLQSQYADASIIMVFDGKGLGVRAEWADDYKANRSPTPPEIKTQTPQLQEIIAARGIPVVVEDNVEADDLIATLTQQAKKSEFNKIIIASGDKDLAQLVGEQVLMLYDDKNNILWDSQGVKDKYGVPPQLIPDYLTLIGDKVDNIHGVDKVGPKTAISWIEKYTSLQGVIDNSDEIGGKVGENLRAALGYLPLSFKMNTLISDIPLSQPLSKLKQQAPDVNKLTELYTKFGLRHFLSVLVKAKPAEVTRNSVITKKEEWQKLLQKLQKSKTFAISVCSSNSNFMTSKIVGLAFATQESEGFYVPCGHDYADVPEQLQVADIIEDMRGLLASKDTKMLGHNLKFLAHLFVNQGQVGTAEGAQHAKYAKYIDAMLDASDDIMLMSYIANSAADHDLDSLSFKHLNHNKQKLDDLAGKGKARTPMNLLEIDKVSGYMAEEAVLCLRVHKILDAQLRKEKTLRRVYAEIDLPLVKILRQAEGYGSLLDTDLLAKQSKQLGKSMATTEGKIFKLAGTEFNISSPAQLKEILFDKMGFKSTTKTGGGQASTAEPVLLELAKEHEFPRLILEYRGFSKLKSTYTDALPQLVNPTTKRIHTSFNQAVASTGRLSSANPNLQNIPMRTDEGRNVRAAFIAPPGMVIAAADYSQIELRIMAHLSDDASLVRAFELDQDVHSATAAEVFDVPLAKVDRDQRRRAKIINFGLIYGMGPFGLAKQLGISNKEGQDFVALYFSRYPGVLKYMEDVRDSASKKGWAETLSGRRVYLPQINSDNFMAKQAAIRAAINAPVQGSAADLIKLAMIKLQPQLKAAEAELILQVHDELVFEIREDLLDKYEGVIKQTMEEAILLSGPLKVPLRITFSQGKNWKSAH